MPRVANFNPGPAALPLPALEKARDELLDFEGTGMSILEHSHRSAPYLRLHEAVKEGLRRLLAIPKSHTVLFLSGGASTHFAQVPMNFLREGAIADYVLTGHWSERAAKDAEFYGKVRIAATTAEANGRYTRIPAESAVSLDPKAAYVHTTSNNTLMGTQFQVFPKTGSLPHVCDMCSDLLSRRFPVEDFALVYGAAQKNMGPAGAVVVIANEAFLKTGRTDIPKIFRYQTAHENDSLYNTPATFAVYFMRNVIAWIDSLGGMPGIEARNTAKAKAVYAALDEGFYIPFAERDSRSLMNVTFRCPTDALDAAFVAEAHKQGMVGLKGHRITGGLRASLYNAVSPEDAQMLASFMRQFAAKHG